MKKNNAMNDDRLKYWNNNYVNYWERRVREANEHGSGESQMVRGDVTASTDNVYRKAIGLLDINAKHQVLELGCGFGRSLPTLSLMAAEVAAVDISEQMINAARREFGAPNITFRVSPAEDLPFEDGKFDRIVCFAAFDAMWQTEALMEMHRVCKPGGKVLLTGKNDHYHNDDTKAYEAEVGAREKGHPNYYTDVKMMFGDLGCFGMKVVSSRYYERRGDFSDGLEISEMPIQFYEYLFVLEKNGVWRVDSDRVYYSPISKTYSALQQSHG